MMDPMRLGSRMREASQVTQTQDGHAGPTYIGIGCSRRGGSRGLNELCLLRKTRLRSLRTSRRAMRPKCMEGAKIENRTNNRGDLKIGLLARLMMDPTRLGSRMREASQVTQTQDGRAGPTYIGIGCSRRGGSRGLN
jgi:hypothetical protein